MPACQEFDCAAHGGGLLAVSLRPCGTGVQLINIGRALYASSVAAAALTLLALPASAQVVTENAGIVSLEAPILRESVSFFESENLRETRWTTQFIFALDSTRELKLSLPLLSRESTFHPAGSGEETADLFGLGDASIRFKQSLWQRDDVMESTRWALLTELGVPTADDDAEENGAPIPPRLRLGTGDWSLGAGSAFTSILDRHRFSAEAFYRYRTRHEDIQLGSSTDLNLAYWYRLSPVVFRPEEETTEVRGVVELLSSYRFASEVGDDSQDDDGLLVWLAPGIQVYPGTSVLFEASVQVPLYQDLDDAVGDRHWAASLVVKLLF